MVVSEPVLPSPAPIMPILELSMTVTVCSGLILDNKIL